MTAKAFSSRACPISAERVRALREAFGEDCRVLYVQEGGVERGDPKAVKDLSQSNQGEKYEIA